MPTNRTPTINSEVAIGCRMNQLEKPPFMARAPWAENCRPLSGARRRRLGRLHQRADLESILSGHHDPLAGRQALLDDRLAVAALADLDVLDADLVVVADDEGIEPVRSALNRVIGNHDRVLQRVDQQAGRHREARPQHIVLVLEDRLHADGAARLVDLVVDAGEPPLRQRPQPVRAQRLHRNRGSLLERLVDQRHVLFRRREHHGDRLQLHDRHDAVLIGVVHDVARIDQAEPGSSRQRRLDDRVAELGLGIVDRRLIALDLGGQLIDHRLLRVDLLLGGVILLGQAERAVEVEPRVLQVGLVLRLLGQRLVERRLIGPRIDFDEGIALLHHPALLEQDLDDLAVDAAAHGNGAERLHRPETVQIDGEVRLLHRRDGDRDRRRGASLAAGRLEIDRCIRRPGRHEIVPAAVAADENRGEREQ